MYIMLKIDNLNVKLNSENDEFNILRNVSLQIKKGDILGLAGESGSGKSVLAKTILGLNKSPIEKVSGKIIFDNKELITNDDYKSIRGKKVSMIFQNPTGSLNPVISIGSQIVETIMLHDKSISKNQAIKKAEELLTMVEIDRPKERLNSYPHQLSGGMNQRVMIAIALASNPELLIADEPTTALDVTIQSQIIKLLLKLNKEHKFTMLFISHDLSLLMNICNKIAVLYCGEIMEIVSKEDLCNDNLHHPYTIALKSCILKIGNKNFLTTIKGSIGKNNSEKDNQCIFSERCSYCQNKCNITKPVFDGNYACHYPIGIN